jgi:Protein of unknown function (DUF1552)
MNKFTRRSMLGGAGAALSSFWLPGVGRLEAQEDPITRRKLLYIYADGGWVTRQLRMRPPWAPAEWSTFNFYEPATWQTPDEMEWEFDFTDSRLTEDDFSPILKPLYRHRDLMTVTEGCVLATDRFDQYGDQHARNHIHMWSCVPSLGEVDGVGSRGSVPSPDQRINEFLQQTNPNHKSMDFRVSEPVILHEYLYGSDGAGGATRLTFETSPQAAYDRFFGGIQQGDPLAANARVSLGLALKQFDDLAPRMLSADRLKLEAHRDLLASVERQYGAVVSCDSVSRPAGISEGMTRVEKLDADCSGFASIIAAGFVCGLSRVASIGSITAHPESYGLDESTNIHHEFEHVIMPELFFQAEGQTQEWLDKEDAMARRNVKQMEQLARIIDVLRDVPDGEGTSLLDNTLVVYMSELSHGGHGREHFPTIMFGGGAGLVTPGRYIKYPQKYPSPFGSNYGNEFTGPAHSRLIIAILQGFGLDIDYLTAPSMEGESPHTNQRATYELSGPLERLTV